MRLQYSFHLWWRVKKEWRREGGRGGEGMREIGRERIKRYFVLS
jgi:hypothetical protein